MPFRIGRQCYRASESLLRRYHVVPRTLNSTLCTKENTSRLLVLGIETSCDDTGAAVVNDDGEILGEALHSQTPIHVE